MTGKVIQLNDWRPPAYKFSVESGSGYVYASYGEWGACPECGIPGSRLDVGKKTFIYCPEHRLTWYVGEFGTGEQTDAERRRAERFIADFTAGYPLLSGTVVIGFDPDCSKDAILRQIRQQLRFLENNWDRLDFSGD